MVIWIRKGGESVIYLSILYIFVLAVFKSAIGGFLIYKVSHNFKAGSLSQILGGIVTLVLSYLMALMIFEGVWFFLLPIAVIAIVVYIGFLLFSKGNLVLIKWVGIIALIMFIAVHVYLIIATII